jgi:hypothetical protein
MNLANTTKVPKSILNFTSIFFESPIHSSFEYQAQQDLKFRRSKKKKKNSTPFLKEPT